MCYLFPFAISPPTHNLLDRFSKRCADIPRGIVFAEFTEVAVVADVVADAVFLGVGVSLRLPGEFFHQDEGFQDWARVGFASPQVIGFAATRAVDKCLDEASHVLGMDIVSNLFPLVAKNLVFNILEVALHEITEKAVQFDAGMVGAG